MKKIPFFILKSLNLTVASLFFFVLISNVNLKQVFGDNDKSSLSLPSFSWMKELGSSLGSSLAPSKEVKYTLATTLFNNLDKIEIELGGLGINFGRDVYDNFDTTNPYFDKSLTIADEFNMKFVVPLPMLGFQWGLANISARIVGQFNFKNLRLVNYKIESNKNISTLTQDEIRTRNQLIQEETSQAALNTNPLRNVQSEFTHSLAGQDSIQKILNSSTEDIELPYELSKEKSQKTHYQEAIFENQFRSLWNILVVPFRFPWVHQFIKNMKNREIFSYELNLLLEGGPQVGYSFPLSFFNGEDSPSQIGIYMKLLRGAIFRVSILKIIEDNEDKIFVRLEQIKRNNFGVPLKDQSINPLSQPYGGYSYGINAKLDIDLYEISPVDHEFKLKIDLFKLGKVLYNSQIKEVGYSYDLTSKEAQKAYNNAIIIPELALLEPVLPTIDSASKKSEQVIENCEKTNRNDCPVKRLFSKNTDEESDTTNLSYGTIKLSPFFKLIKEYKASFKNEQGEFLVDDTRQILNNIVSTNSNEFKLKIIFFKLKEIMKNDVEIINVLNPVRSETQKALIFRSSVIDDSTNCFERNSYFKTINILMGQDLLPILKNCRTTQEFEDQFKQYRSSNSTPPEIINFGRHSHQIKFIINQDQLNKFFEYSSTLTNEEKWNFIVQSLNMREEFNAYPKSFVGIRNYNGRLSDEVKSNFQSFIQSPEHFLNCFLGSILYDPLRTLLQTFDATSSPGFKCPEANNFLHQWIRLSNLWADGKQDQVYDEFPDLFRDHFLNFGFMSTILNSMRTLEIGPLAYEFVINGNRTASTNIKELESILKAYQYARDFEYKRFSVDSNLSVNNLKIDVLENLKADLSFDLETIPDEIIIRLIRFGYPNKYLSTLFIPNSDDETLNGWKMGNNTFSIDANGSDVHGAQLGQYLKPGGTYKLVLFARSGEKVGPAYFSNSFTMSD